MRDAGCRMQDAGCRIHSPLHPSCVQWSPYQAGRSGWGVQWGVRTEWWMLDPIAYTPYSTCSIPYGLPHVPYLAHGLHHKNTPSNIQHPIEFTSPIPHPFYVMKNKLSLIWIHEVDGNTTEKKITHRFHCILL